MQALLRRTPMGIPSHPYEPRVVPHAAPPPPERPAPVRQGQAGDDVRCSLLDAPRAASAPSCAVSWLGRDGAQRADRLQATSRVRVALSAWLSRHARVLITSAHGYQDTGDAHVLITLWAWLSGHAQRRGAVICSRLCPFVPRRSGSVATAWHTSEAPAVGSATLVRVDQDGFHAPVFRHAPNMHHVRGPEQWICRLSISLITGTSRGFGGRSLDPIGSSDRRPATHRRADDRDDPCESAAARNGCQRS